MSIRQVRLTTLTEMQKRLGEFTGKKINIVLRNRKVFFGELISVDQAQLTFVNMRQARSSLALNEISEVYLDFKD